MNRLPAADNSHEISCLIFSENLKMMILNLSSAAVVIGPLRVKLASNYFKLLNISIGILQLMVWTNPS